MVGANEPEPRASRNDIFTELGELKSYYLSKFRPIGFQRVVWRAHCYGWPWAMPSSIWNLLSFFNHGKQSLRWDRMDHEPRTWPIAKECLFMREVHSKYDLRNSLEGLKIDGWTHLRFKVIPLKRSASFIHFIYSEKWNVRLNLRKVVTFSTTISKSFS